MKVFSTATLLTLGAVALAAPSQPMSEERRSTNYTATLLSDISTIQSRLNTLDSDVNAFTGGSSQVLQALGIYTDAENLQSALNQATSDTIAASQFNNNDSASISTAVTALQPAIYNVLSELIAKKSGFETVIFGGSAVPLVNSTIISLQTSTNYFSGNLTSKFSAQFQLLAPLVTGDIAYHFDRAAEDYYTP